MKKVKALFIFFLAFLIAPSLFAEELPLTVEISTEVKSVKASESFDVLARVKNTSLSEQGFFTMSCSYSVDWSTDNSLFSIEHPPECEKNVLYGVALESGESREFKFILVVSDQAKPGPFTFKLGFKPIDHLTDKLFVVAIPPNKNFSDRGIKPIVPQELIWSNSITIEVLPQE